MDVKQKNTLLAAGIVCGLVSLPLTWLTIRNAEVQGMPAEFGSMFQNMTVHVTGMNGNITLLVKTPLWFVIGVAVAANGLQLMRSSNLFAIPTAALWIVAIAAACWVTIPIPLILASGKATVGLGWLLGLCCAAAPLIALLTSTTPDSKNA